MDNFIFCAVPVLKDAVALLDVSGVLLSKQRQSSGCRSMLIKSTKILQRLFKNVRNTDMLFVMVKYMTKISSLIKCPLFRGIFQWKISF